jgi:peptide deformylase
MSRIGKGILHVVGLRRAPLIRMCGHPVLRTLAREVPMKGSLKESKDLKDAIAGMTRVFESPFHRPIGLAAPQIGISSRIIAVRIPDDKGVLPDPTFLINPKLILIDPESNWQPEYESCESLPSVSVNYNVYSCFTQKNK